MCIIIAVPLIANISEEEIIFVHNAKTVLKAAQRNTC